MLATGDEDICLEENAGRNRRKHRPGTLGKEPHQNTMSTKWEFKDKKSFPKNEVSGKDHSAEEKNCDQIIFMQNW